MKLFGKSESFIGVYDNALSKKECEILISEFEKSNPTEGTVLHEGVYKVDPTYKKCRQLSLSFSEGKIITNIISCHLSKCVKKYVSKYDVLERYNAWSADDTYTFQKYETEDDGFKTWHCEHGPGGENRIMAWMFYLNNAKSGTDFMYYPNINAKEGRCVIWPAGWSHFHKGAPNKGLKYIVTGWISFE